MPLTCPAVLLGKDTPDTRGRPKSSLQKDQIPSNKSPESDTSDRLHTKMGESYVGDHEVGSLSALESQQQMSQSFSWSVRNVAILASLCVVVVLSFGALFMLASFYPHEANSRGVSISVVGLVFATYPLLVFISAPICGLMIAKYGPIRVLYFGVLTGGTSLTLFGFCAWISSKTVFMVSSFLLRALSALGGAASETSAMSIAIEAFPERLGLVSGFIETFVGLGASFGPVFGGVLYTLGGFELPFFVIGCSMIAAIPVLFCTLSSGSIGYRSDESSDQGKALFPIVESLKIPAVSMLALCFITAGLTQSYFEPILGLHLEKVMNLNTTQIGLTFLVCALLYALFTPLWGWIGDKTQCYRWLAVSGLIGAGFSSLLLGPAPFLTSFLPTKKVWFVNVAMSVAGLSWGVYFVQLMPDLVKVMREKLGMPDSSSTRGVVSSIFSGMVNLGATIGPTLAGIIDDHIGFQWAMAIAGIFCFVQAAGLMAFTLIGGTDAKRQKNPYSPLVAPDSSDGEEEMLMHSKQKNILRP